MGYPLTLEDEGLMPTGCDPGKPVRLRSNGKAETGGFAATQGALSDIDMERQDILYCRYLADSRWTPSRKAVCRLAVVRRLASPVEASEGDSGRFSVSVHLQQLPSTISRVPLSDAQVSCGSLLSRSRP